MYSLARLALGLALALAGGLAAAQTWPTKTVRVMVGASPGGGTDIIARMLADKYQAAFGQPFVVENRPGASNTIAADLTAKAPPDGQTLLVATNTAQAIAPHLIKLGFDPLKDLAPVALIVVVPNVLVVDTDVPANNVKELVALIKANPEQVLLRLVRHRQHAAPRGRGVRARSGHEDRPHPVQGLQPGARRSRRRPDPDRRSTPPLRRWGFIKSGKVQPARGDVAEARSPRTPRRADARGSRHPGRRDDHLVRSLHHRRHARGRRRPAGSRRPTKVLKMPDVQKRLEGLGGEPGNMTPAQLAAMNKADYERFGALIRDANIKIEQ